MTHQTRLFTVDQTGGVQPLAHDRFVALARHAARAPEFAGQQVMLIDWYLRIEEGRAQEVVNETCSWLVFDDHGALDLHAAAAIDAAASPSERQWARIRALVFGEGARPVAVATTESPSRQGLSSAEAARRLAADGPNLLPGSAPKSSLAIVRGVLGEPMFLMLLAAGGIYLALGDRAEALFLLGFVFIVIGITLVQERRTQRALESLRDLSAPRALVLRDGQEQRIAGREVVRGDWLVLHEGDRVPADARLLEGQLAVDESLLTGEAVPVHIVLLELLIDPACSVVFEAEPAEPGLMERPPRARDASPFSRSNLWAGALQGGGLAALLLAGHAAMTAWGLAEAQARGAVFVALVLGVLLLIIANRHPARSPWVGTGTRNPWLWPMTGAVGALLALVFGVPALRRVMGLAWPGGTGLGAMALLVLLAAGWLLAARPWLPSR